MTVGRSIYLLVLFGVLAAAVIGLRAEQIRAAARIEQLQWERVALRRSVWAVQMEVGRVRNPQQIRDRVARWSLDIREPYPPSDEVLDHRLLAQR